MRHGSDEPNAIYRVEIAGRRFESSPHRTVSDEDELGVAFPKSTEGLEEFVDALLPDEAAEVQHRPPLGDRDRATNVRRHIDPQRDRTHA